jgi:hypothetical protein
MATQDDYVKTALRLPRSVHAKLQEAADASAKSMNSEIIARLEASFTGGDQSALITAIARLNLNLANLEIDLTISKLEAGLLAQSLRHAGALLLDQLARSDLEHRALAQKYIRQATPHLKKVDDYDAEMQTRIEQVSKAALEMRRNAPVLNQVIGEAAESDGDNATLPHAADLHPDLVVGDNVELPGKRATRKKPAK